MKSIYALFSDATETITPLNRAPYPPVVLDIPKIIAAIQFIYSL
jgi:hypothetical protein